jgi:hypothetical protein
MRISKIKSLEHIKAANMHNQRLMIVHNANPSVNNKQLIGKMDVMKDFEEYTKGAKKPRKNAVLCIEQVLTASPEFFKDDKTLRKWVKHQLRYLKKKWGENCINAVLHLDEKTPHIHAMIVPLVDNGFNAKKLIGGNKNVLSDMQDEYAELMHFLGLKRGEKGSEREHIALKDYYASQPAAAPQCGAHPCDIRERDGHALNPSLC